MIEITRRFEFDAGHRVVGHEGKCATLHGHRYAAEVTLTCLDLDKLGRVIDFGKVKSIIGTWIDDHWDHAMILKENDPLLEFLRASPGTFASLIGQVIGPRRVWMMPENPTAENMSRKLFRIIADELLVGFDLTVTKVRLYETPNCWSDYTP